MKQKIVPFRAGHLQEPAVRVSQKIRWVFKLIVIFQLFGLQLNAQTLSPSQLRGKILSPEGTPLQGASVFIAGTKSGSTTDVDGRFSINNPNTGKKVTLEISSVGFLSKAITHEGQADITITLEKSIAGLDEVVVVGYGTQRKTDLVGSIAQVSAKKLMDRPAFNVGQALQGKVSGVQVVQQGGGLPGGDPMIRIRGTNSINTSSDPLFVVDGIVGVANALSTLNPEDIVSLDVLKDASATAIYGARGANGVIIITTKRGVNGQTQVDYNAYVSRSVLQRHLYTLNADQLMYVYEQAMANGEKYGTVNRAKDFRGRYATSQSYSEMPWLFQKVSKGSYLLDLIGKDGNYYAPIYNSDWEKEAFKPATSNNHHIDVRGGNENAKFSLSLGYSDQNGLMQESYFKRYSARMTGDIKVLKWLDMNTQIVFNKSRRTNDDGITRSTAEVWSILPTKYPNDPSLGIYAGRWGTNADFNVGEQWYNIVFRRSEIHGFTDLSQSTGSIALNARIADGLTFKTNVAIDFNASKFNNYSGKLYGSDGTATINTANTFFWQNENYFNYDKKIGDDHNVNALLGLSWSKFNFENLNAVNSVFFTNFYEWHNIGAGAATRPVPQSSDGMNTLNSYFARINYGFKNKYLLTATGRIDGSSKFGANSKYGFFPSVGVAWKASEENFIKDIKALSNLKFRGSVGRTGNQEIGSYVSQTYVGSSGIVLGGAASTGLFPSSVGNPDLKWETTTQYDAGFELGLFRDKINLTIDYYHKVTKDMLLDVPLPTSTTPGTAKMNYGSVQNNGWEFGVNSRNVSTKNFKWNTDLSLTLNRNKILGLGPTGASIFVSTGAGNGTSILQVGQPIGSFFGLTRLGTYSTEEATLAARYGMLPGDLKFLDRNNDGKIDLNSDGGVIGQSFPKVLAGFNNYFNYKNFDASINIQIVLGIDKAFVHESAEDRQLVSGGLNTTLTAWRPDAQNSMVAQLRPGNGGAYYQSYPDTHMIYDASFIRGSGATLGYSFDGKKMGLQKLRAYASATNFFLITEAAGYDPEGSSIDKKYSLAPNIDKYQYPNPATYTLGVNISL
jgi:TonB-linked SusC/RagA family outer membrane protein